MEGVAQHWVLVCTVGLKGCLLFFVAQLPARQCCRYEENEEREGNEGFRTLLFYLTTAFKGINGAFM